MKHLIISIFAALAAVLSASAATVTLDGVEYTLRNGTYTVTGWDEDNPSPKIHIRGIVNGLEVTAIDPNAFTDNATMKYLYIDEGVSRIGYNAFDRCSALKHVVMPEGLTVIEEEAFAFCNALATVVVPSTVNNIGSHAFWGCTGVTDVYFLIDDTDALALFDWWDGVFAGPGEDEHGGLEFNTVENTTVHVPQGMLESYIESGKFEAWLDNMREDDDSYPLWWIVNYGLVGHCYTVADDLLAVHVDVNGDVYAKDDNHWLMPDVVGDDEVDFMQSTDLMLGRDYDQSNWVVLLGVDSPQALLAHWLRGGTITGTLADRHNPVIEVEAGATIEAGGADSYIPNVYVPSAFMGRSQQGADGVTYAWMQPKPQECVTIDWAVCADDYGADYAQAEFYMPASDGQWVNPMELRGGFAIDDAIYESIERPALQLGDSYRFNAIVRQRDTDDLPLPGRRGLTPYVDGGRSTTHTVLPLSFDPGIITGLDRINAATPAAPEGVYDMQGRRVADPSSGIYVIGRKVTVVNRR